MYAGLLAFMRGCLLRRIALRQLCAVLFTAAMLTALLAMPALADDPAADIRSLVDRTLSVVRSKEMSLAAKRGEFRDMIERNFDVAGMARDSLGEHWPQLSAGAQSKFSQAFNSLVADTYLGELRDFDREQIQNVSQELSGANAEVSGSMRNSNDEVADLKFKLRNIAGRWKVNDYSLNTQSAMGNYRGDFRQAFEKGGFDGLMSRVKELQAKLDADLTRNRGSK
jgi:ABC-type transporter MlaC component